MSQTDTNGVEYESNFGILKRAPVGLSDYEILASCHTIKGGSSASDSPFFGCTKCTSITFAKNSKLSTIGSYAFSSFQNLRSIDFTNCELLATIPSYCFANSQQLTSVILPETLTTFSSSCFQQTTSLEYLKCPDSVKTLGYQMIKNSGIKYFNITENCQIQSFSNEAFANSKIVFIYIPKTVTSINGAVFQKCSDLEEIEIHPDNHYFKLYQKKMILDSTGTKLIASIMKGQVTVPSNVTSLESGCFRGSYVTSITFEAESMVSFQPWCLSTTNLISFEFPKGISTIPTQCLSYNSVLTEVILTDEIKMIKTYAFGYCSKLETINLKNVSEIKDYAFLNCDILGTVSLPPSLTTLGKSVFAFCPKLQIDSSQNNNFHIEDGMLFQSSNDPSQKNILSEFFGQQTIVYLPSFCTIICSGAFATKSIDTVIFNSAAPDMQIQENAFQSSSIKNISFPSYLTLIGDSAFQKCDELTSVSFDPNCQIQKIPYRCFYQCDKLHEIQIPNSVIEIGAEAFSECNSIETFDFSASVLSTINESAFKNSSIISIILPNTITTIEKNAFMNSKLQSIEYNKQCQLNIVSSSCFEYAVHLTTVNLSDFIETIDTRAFYHCDSLIQITLPKNIEILEYNSFQYCSQLITVSLAKDCNLTTIKGSSFNNCPLLLNITLDENDTKLKFEDGALFSKDYKKLIFYLPSSKVSLFVVPANVTNINDYAFADCENLKTVIITYGNIRSIGYRAFANCTKLSTIYIPRGINSISGQVFDGCTSFRCGSIITFPEIHELLEDQKINAEFYSENCPSVSITCYCKSSRSFLPYLFILLAGKY